MVWLATGVISRCSVITLDLSLGDYPLCLTLLESWDFRS